jgi:diguanylate cyclase (GGDEF)-like protein
MRDNAERARVLLVDDSPQNIEVLAEALSAEYELLVATTAPRALAIAPLADLILLDVLMPGMGGLEVCRRLRAENETRETPVIFVTALESADDETTGFAAGAVDYIAKPIHPAVVRARVRTHLELKRARDLLAKLASSDALTGIANRRRFDETLREEWRRAAREGRSFALGLADVDHFKRFNDTHGHASGDVCLRAVAQALAAAARRQGDLVARWGGEEFALAFPDVDRDGARGLARRVLDTIDAVEVPLGEDRFARVSLSLGLTVERPAASTSFEDALRRADSALYGAKAQGRRRAILRDATVNAEETILPSPGETS